MKQKRGRILSAAFATWFLLLGVYFYALFQTSKSYKPLVAILAILWLAGCGCMACSLKKANDLLCSSLPKRMIMIDRLFVFYLWGLTYYLALETKQIFAGFSFPYFASIILSLYLLVGMYYPFWMLARRIFNLND